MPAAAIASVISAARSGPATAVAKVEHAVVQVHPVGDQLADHVRARPSSATTGPGSRWCTGRMPLNRWVPTLAPAATAARVCS